MKKIGFVVQRYGLEVNGGAELHCRQLVEKLQGYYDVEVLTTRALDYVTWADYYPEGIDEVNGIVVRRFSVDHERNNQEFNESCYEVIGKNVGKKRELDWMEKQGPTASQLVRYLMEHQNEYDAYVFITYLYYTTFHGVLSVPQKAFVIPTAHDEPPIYLGIYEEFFKSVKAFFYNTIEEKNFIESRFDVENVPNNGGYGGVGVDVPDDVMPERFKKEYELDNYIIYVGRIDVSKGCEQLFEFYHKYKMHNESNLKLVLVGKAVMPIPANPDIIHVGFLSEKDKFDAISGSRLLVLPSQFESLSMAVLEAFSVSKAVLVNGNCEVLRGHCDKSNGGRYYKNYGEFENQLNIMLSDNELCRQMGINGKKYLEDNYSWDVIINNFNELFNRVF